jgi:hypothetical protein
MLIHDLPPFACGERSRSRIFAYPTFASGHFRLSGWVREGAE